MSTKRKLPATPLMESDLQKGQIVRIVLADGTFADYRYVKRFGAHFHFERAFLPFCKYSHSRVYLGFKANWCGQWSGNQIFDRDECLGLKHQWGG